MLNAHVCQKITIMRSGAVALLRVAALSVSRPWDAVSMSWKAVNHVGQAVPMFRNSHATAMAALVKYHGLKKQNESDRPLVATCWMYAQWAEEALYCPRVLQHAN